MKEVSLQQYNAPTSIVIFGGTGDLAQTKLLPALLDLFRLGVLPDSFVLIGLSRQKLSTEAYKQFVFTILSDGTTSHSQSVLEAFCEHIRYVSGSFEDSDTYEKIKQSLHEYDTSIGQCTNKLFYLAVPPQYYGVIFDTIAKSDAMKLCDGVGSWSRLLVEKPFGKDLSTARQLEKKLCSLFADEQIYRIDHYLAKDAIENIMSLRFANSILEQSWSPKNIQAITIRMLETKDVAKRGAFYDGIGALRDVGQNHVLQILALLLMPAVNIHDQHAVRAARAAVIASLENVSFDSVVRAQYQGYKETAGVNPDSHTETYFNVSFTMESSEWQGVHVTLEAGKALNTATSEAVITFAPNDDCQHALGMEMSEFHNTLQIRFAPEKHISLSMWVKKPGFSFELVSHELVLTHEKFTTDEYSPEAYERVLYDCIAGDQTRFVSGKEVEAAWQFITPLIEKFNNLPLYEYQPGTTSTEIGGGKIES